MHQPRPEYPRPQMVREPWINLNGTWEFELDQSLSGEERSYFKRDSLDQKITVPFCPESKLSGVEYTDFINGAWYRKEIELTKDWCDQRTLLHFGAVDYDTKVWINQKEVGTHKGGYASFCFDVTDHVKPGKNHIVVFAKDDVRSGKQPAGKQSIKYDSYECSYTRTTGIWQTVWLENVKEVYVQSLKYRPDPDNGCVHVQAKLSNPTDSITATAYYQNKEMGQVTVKASQKDVFFTLPLSEVHLWGPKDPKLYDMKVSLSSGDSVDSYFGLRTIDIKDLVIEINHKPVFQRLVLDQGFYPDGIYTAPSDQALKNDILLSMDMGFNGARLHEKIFEPRFLYWADQLGYLVWEEHANWNMDHSTHRSIEYFLPEWLEIMERDHNHPSIIGWCPFNETWDREGKRQCNFLLEHVYQITKQFDPTRPVIDTSGNYHVKTDIYDIHNYEQNTKKFKETFDQVIDGSTIFDNFPDRQTYDGQPYFISEYGGIKWDVDNVGGWGYGDGPKTKEEFIDRYRSLTHTLLDHPMVCAFCYTQLYDVEQEVNGLYTYQRKPKFDPQVIREINQKKAKIEE